MRVSGWFLLALGALFAAGTLVLATALFRLQVLDTATYREDLETQTTRRIQIAGLRGRILDRNGIVLADCRPIHGIACRLEEFQRRGNPSNTVNAADAAIDALALAVGLKRPDAASRERLARHLRIASAKPFTVWDDLDPAAFARFSEQAADFPGFEATVSATRVYPYGSLASHLLGFVGTDLPEREEGDKVYHIVDKELHGRAGVEGTYNAYLAGASGEMRVKVDARGFRPKGDAARDETGRSATVGPDLQLTLDAKLQHVLEKTLVGVTGAGVVLDPRDGAVLALASAPAFDPNDCVPRLTPETYFALTNAPAKRGHNRALAEYYAPGSIFKPVTALAALRAGIPSTHRCNCTGIYRGLKCWDIYGHGDIDMRQALMHSCNVYFCELGHAIGTNALFSMAREFGLGAATGIDLGGERAGALANGRWYPGFAWSSAIGQGLLQLTPLQMAVMAAALANGGKVYRPYLKRRGKDEPSPAPIRTVACSPAQFDLVRLGMRDVVERGTGQRVLTRFGEGRDRFRLRTTCAGKTGTAEVGAGATRRKNAWVVAFAPYDDPIVAIAMVVERGEGGGKTTAPRVHEVFASIFGEEKL